MPVWTAEPTSTLELRQVPDSQYLAIEFRAHQSTLKAIGGPSQTGATMFVAVWRTGV
jgi:hypothetical protein